ncbi:MAG: Uma2 family endonuclease [Bacteroidota bacterium]
MERAAVPHLHQPPGRHLHAARAGPRRLRTRECPGRVRVRRAVTVVPHLAGLPRGSAAADRSRRGGEPARKPAADAAAHAPERAARSGSGGAHRGDPREERRPRHQALASRLTAYLLLHIEDNNLGSVFTAPIDLVLDPEAAAVQPDVVFVATDRISIITETHLEGTPSLVVEVVSPSSRRRDEQTKRHLYAQHGVPEYWVVDPDAGTVQVFRLDASGRRYARAATLVDGDILTTPLLPDWSLSLARLFAP